MNARRITTRLVLDLETGQEMERESYLYAGPVAECRGGQQTRLNQQTQLSNQLNSLGQQVFGLEMPALQSEIEHPGFTPAEQDTMRQNAFGSVNSNFNSAADKAENQGAATRNTANMGALLDNLARERGRALSDAALKTDQAIADARLRGLQSGISQANQLFGVNENNAAQLLGKIPNSSWKFGFSTPFGGMNLGGANG